MNESTTKDPTGKERGRNGAPGRRPSPDDAGAPTPETDAHETRRRLLEAGRRLFASRGFRGTSVRVLTSEAGANLGAVTYHFESKEGLYRAVLEECLGPIRERAAAARGLPLSPMARIEVLVKGMFRHLAENPDMTRFMVQELVIGERPAPEVVGMLRAMLGALVEILEEGQADGSILPGDPVLQALTVISQPIYLSVVPAVLSRKELSEGGLPRPTGSAESHAIAILRRALLAHEEEEE